MTIEKQQLKERIHSKIDELIDGAETIGSLGFFEINVKHINGDICIELTNKFKEKV